MSSLGKFEKEKHKTKKRLNKAAFCCFKINLRRPLRAFPRNAIRCLHREDANASSNPRYLQVRQSFYLLAANKVYHLLVKSQSLFIFFWIIPLRFPPSY